MSEVAERNTITTFFIRNPLFADFSLSDLEKVAGSFFLKEFPENTLVLSEGEPNEGLGFVEGGLLCSTKTVPHFGEKELSTVGPGEVIGEVSLVDDLPHTANVRCVKHSRLVLARKRDLQKLFEESSGIRYKFYGIFNKTISRYLRDVNDRLTTFFQQGPSRGAPPASRVREMVPLTQPRLGRERIAQILRELDLFKGLSDSEIALLTTVIKEVHVERDDVVFREGARGDTLFVVAQGSVRISKFFPGVGEEALTVLAPGEFFGDMSLFDDKPRSATAIGNASGTMLFGIGKASIENLAELNLAGGCALYELLARIQCKRLRNTINTVSFWQILSGHTADLKIDGQ